MKYNFDRIVERRGTHSAKWEFASISHPKADHDTLPLWVADMDFACAPPIVQAIKKRADQEIFGYSIPFTGEYYRALGSWYQRRFGWYVDSNNIRVTAGIVPALSALIRGFTEEGDGVIIQKPVYKPFTKNIETNKRVVVNNRLINTDGYYTMNFEDLEEKAKRPENKMMILCSPHNPVGRVWTEEELRRVGEICIANDVLLVSDEIHFDLIRKGHRHIVLDSLFPEEDRIITCTAPSKTFNLAGMHTSHIIIKSSEMKNRWKEVVGSQTPNPLSISAVQAAFDESEDWVDQVNVYLDDNMQFIEDYLKMHLPKARFRKPEGTYLAWIDLEAYGLKGQELDDLILEDGKVLLEGGRVFDEEAAYHQRINAACPKSILEEALKRLSNSLNKVRTGEAYRPFVYDTPWKSGLVFNPQGNRKSYLQFLRYEGCSFCRLDMIDLQEQHARFADSDTDVYIVLQSSRDLVKSQLSDADYPYTIICDPQGELYSKYNLSQAYSMQGMLTPGTLAKGAKVQAMGIEHGAYEGNELQFPAAFVFDGSGRATYVQYGQGPGDVPSPDEILDHLQGGTQ